MQIVVQPGQEAIQLLPTADKKTRLERVTESSVEGDPATFAVDEPVRVPFGSALSEKNKQESIKDE